MNNKLRPVHPGEILTEDFLAPMQPDALRRGGGYERTAHPRVARPRSQRTRRCGSDASLVSRRLFG